MNTYSKFLTMISTEFDRYVMENEEFAKSIPQNAMIIFQVHGEEEFNTWHKTLSLKNREPDQPVIYVQIHKWRVHSLIEEVSLAKAA